VKAKIVDPQNLRGQDYDRRLSQQTLDQVRLNHAASNQYMDVDLKNQANAEGSATRDYRGAFCLSCCKMPAMLLPTPKTIQSGGRTSFEFALLAKLI
jgi:hypothetical protein